MGFVDQDMASCDVLGADAPVVGQCLQNGGLHAVKLGISAGTLLHGLGQMLFLFFHWSFHLGREQISLNNLYHSIAQRRRVGSVATVIVVRRSNLLEVRLPHLLFLTFIGVFAFRERLRRVGRTREGRGFASARGLFHAEAYHSSTIPCLNNLPRLRPFPRLLLVYYFGAFFFSCTVKLLSVLAFDYFLWEHKGFGFLGCSAPWWFFSCSVGSLLLNVSPHLVD